MIECEFIGGPRDGERVALPDNRPIRVAVARQDLSRYLPYVESTELTTSPTFYMVEMYPELTANGWVLRWKEPT